MNRHALITALAGLGLTAGVAVGVAAAAPDQPTPIIAAGASASSEEATTTSTTVGTADEPADEPTTTTVAPGEDPAPEPSTTSTTEVHHEPTTSTTRPPEHPGEEPRPTTTTTEVHREPTTTTTEVRHEPTTMEIACGMPEHEFGIVCEWTDAPEHANHLVLLRRTRDTDLQPSWRTEDMSVHRHVDGTVEPGGGYGYQVRAYVNDELVAVRNLATQMAPRPAPASALHLECATPANDGGPASVGCEWNDPPAGTDHWVLMRELSGPSQPIWETPDLSVRRHVDDTAEAGATYSYRISAYHGDQLIATSNPVRITAGGEG